MRADTLSINSEFDLKNVLDKLYEMSLHNKALTGLLELIMNKEVIVTAIHNIKANKGSKTKGIDHKTINDFLQMDYEELIQLIQRKIKSYKPLPVKRTYIPKGNSGKMRPLGIPTVLDRIIQESFRIILEPILEAKFFKHSYGFRPYREVGHALGRIHNIVKWKMYYCIEGDFKGYFDNINHRLLLKKLWKLGITDKRVISIIKSMLKAGIIDGSTFSKSSIGTPQGGILSPLLANAYLHTFDKTIETAYEKPFNSDQYSGRGNAHRSLRSLGFPQIYLVRYADDWVIFCKTEHQAKRRLKWLRSLFRSKFKLELSEEKTVITDIRQSPMKFLGFCIKAEPPLPINGRKVYLNHLVAKIYPNPDKVKDQIRNISKEIAMLPTIQGIDNKMAHIENINAKIVGIGEYWSKGLCKKTFNRIDNVIHNRCYFTWKKTFKSNYRKFLIPLNELTNRPNRHSNFTMESWAIVSARNGMRVGITKVKITPSNWCRPFDPEMTPYSPKGRKVYASKTRKISPLARPPLYNFDIAERIKFNKDRKYNFEFYMNREYAFNRDKGKCRVCGDSLWHNRMECHHIVPNLHLGEVNKVSNLAWMCGDCHTNYIHGYKVPINPKIKKKVQYFLNRLVEQK
ncbi:MULTISPECIES: group II intron reverse transcriptase/maturase [Paenibacillus]|uniref:Group II intron reverse transcriptase/maturase n=1 Tax=Paenibacillus xylanilyticus TaxID=248903 RepID=A0A7Y6BVN7_9BACL|nr:MULTISPECIES: group II intron reverse transcriptase/maturase [Paenibacillus]NUU75752.1 group II intron reverse transcriptase/maturase [Paenibacillus xylanilyticus]OMF66838.1 group II intron reverse transcriptase/maturase [Paenibacillus glucanolyticus]